MENLLIWYFTEIKSANISGFFGLNKTNIPSPESLRLIYNKYKNTEYFKIAKVIYISSFQDSSMKKSRLDPLQKMEKYFQDSESFLDWEELIRLSLAYVIYRPKKFMKW